MSKIPVRCTVDGCGGVVLLDEAYHDDRDDLIGLDCPKGHRFDYDKFRCPRCGSSADPAKWDIVRVSSTGSFPLGRELKPAECTSADCDWSGPKG
jgi:hypothetical protein